MLFQCLQICRLLYIYKHFFFPFLDILTVFPDRSCFINTMNRKKYTYLHLLTESSQLGRVFFCQKSEERLIAFRVNISAR